MRRTPLIAFAVLAALALAPSASAVHPKTVDFIAGFEGFYPKPYNDPAGYATVGYGHLIDYRPVRKSDRKGIWVKGQAKPGRLTEPEARRLLRKRLAAFQKKVCSGIGETPVNLPMMTALTSFIFNLGEGKFLRYKSPYLKKATNVKRKMKKRNYIGAARDMRIYDAIIEGGKRKPLAGLTRRRNEEFALMKEGIRKPKRRGAACTAKAGSGSPVSADPGNAGGLPVG